MGNEVLLFSYGTLQQEPVQRHCFGRRLEGSPDVVAGYRILLQEIVDPEDVALSGARFHPSLVPTRNPKDEVEGTLYRITDGELAAADAYEGKPIVVCWLR